MGNQIFSHFKHSQVALFFSSVCLCILTAGNNMKNFELSLDFLWNQAVFYVIIKSVSGIERYPLMLWGLQYFVCTIKLTTKDAFCSGLDLEAVWQSFLWKPVLGLVWVLYFTGIHTNCQCEQKLAVGLFIMSRGIRCVVILPVTN